MNLTSFIFFTLVGLVTLWVASDYLPNLSTLFSSLFNKVKETTESKVEPNDDNKVVEITKSYVHLRRQLAEMGNDVAIKALDTVFPNINRNLDKK